MILLYTWLPRVRAYQVKVPILLIVCIQHCLVNVGVISDVSIIKRLSLSLCECRLPLRNANFHIYRLICICGVPRCPSAGNDPICGVPRCPSAGNDPICGVPRCPSAGNDPICGVPRCPSAGNDPICGVPRCPSAGNDPICVTIHCCLSIALVRPSVMDGGPFGG